MRNDAMFGNEIWAENRRENEMKAARRIELEDIYEEAFEYAHGDVDFTRMFKAYLDNQYLELEEKMWMLVKLSEDDRVEE